MKDWALARLKERSTRIGLAAILTSAGMTISPEQIEMIVSLVLFISGMAEAAIPDQDK